ncbi:MAG: LamG-like jellyroll fold domain-containing protein, partial [Bacteroidota bacterium]
MADNAVQQAGWVGTGWTLNLGSIVADINKTRDPSDDRYYFVTAGGSSELVLNSGNEFRLKEYQYWKFTRQVSGGNVVGWVVVADDGTTFRYGNYNKNSQSFVFDYGTTNATRFYLGWGNCVTNSTNVTYSSASLISYQWDISDIEDINHNHATISYQLETEYLYSYPYSTTLQYTRASFPFRIEDRTGRRVEFTLSDLSSSEYSDRNQSPGGTSVQSLYQTKYLDYVTIKSSSGATVQIFDLSYLPADASGLGYTKRYFTSLAAKDASVSSLPTTSFEYYGVGGVGQGENKGALKSILYPDGGKVQYQYSYQAMENVTLDMTQTFNSSVYPLVDRGTFLSGMDFVVTKMNNYALRVYRWGINGWFQDDSFPISGTVQNFWVCNDYVVVKENSLSMKVVKRNGDGWMTPYSVSASAGSSPGSLQVIGMSNDWFVVSHNLVSTFWTYPQTHTGTEQASVVRWTNGCWTTQYIGTYYLGAYVGFNPPYGLTGACGTSFFTLGTANDAYSFVRDQCVVYLWDGTQWTQSLVTQPFGTGVPFDLFTGSDYFIAKARYSDWADYKIWHWEGTGWGPGVYYNDINFTEALTANNFFVVIRRDENNQGAVFIKTWNGDGRTGLSPWTTIDASYLFSPGPLGEAHAAAFSDKIALSWLEGSYPCQGKMSVTQFANGAWGTGQDIDWATCTVSGSLLVPVGNGLNLFREDFQVSDYHEVSAYWKNGASWSSTQLSYVALAGNGDNHHVMPGGNFVADVVDPSSTTSGDESIHAFSGGYGQGLAMKFQSSPGDFPVTSKTVTDAMGASDTTSFAYANGIYDETITFAKYNKVTVTPPGNNGKIVTYFYNDLDQSHCEEFVSVGDYQQLDGMPYFVKVYNSSDAIVSQTANTWNAYAIDASKGVYHRRLAQFSTTIDGVTRSTTYAYNNSNGQIWRTVEDADVQTEHGVLRDRMTEVVYAFLSNNNMQNLNMLVQPAEQRVLETGSPIDFQVTASCNPGSCGEGDIESGTFTVNYTQTVSYSCNITAPNNSFSISSDMDGLIRSGGSTSDTLTLFPGRTYTVEANAEVYYSGGSQKPSSVVVTVTFDSGVLVSDAKTEYTSAGYFLRSLLFDGSKWITTDSVASRDTYGNVLEIDNVDKVRTTTLYGFNSALPIAGATNAALSQTVVSVFDDGTTAPWTGGSGTWSVQNGVYKQSNGTATSPWWDSPMTSGSVSLDDAVLEADIRFDNVGTYRYVSIFKYLNAANMVRFELRKSESMVRIYALKANNATYEDVPFIFNENQWYHLRGEIQGSTARLYVDGTLYKTLIHDYCDLGSAPMALGTFATAASFDDVRYYPAGAIVTSQSYDPNTLLINTSTDANGISMCYEYDSFGRLVKTKSTDRNIVSEESYYFSRDGNGGTFSSTDPNYTQTVNYPRFSSQGLVAWYKFEGSVTDESSTGNNGSAPSGSAYGRGIRGKAFSTVGGRYVFVPVTSSLQPANVSVEAWAKTTSFGSYQQVLAQANGGCGCGWPYGFDVLTDGRIRTLIYAINGQSYQVISPGPIQLNTWTHLAATYDGVTLKLFINGQMCGQNTTNAGNMGYGTWGGNIGIGKKLDGCYPSYFLGLIDEVKIYSRALSSDEVLAEYNASVTTTYADGIGRTLQTQALDGANDLVSAVEYDVAGRQYRSWQTFSYNTGHAYDPSYASHAVSIFGISNPHSETVFQSDPLSRVITTKTSCWTTTEEYVNYASGSATIDGQSRAYTEVKSKTTSMNPWMVSRTYFDKLGRSIKTAKYQDGWAEEIVSRTYYTLLGQPYQIVSPMGYSTTNQYDFLGHLVQKNDPDEGASHYMYDRAGRLRFMVDSLGLIQNPDDVLYWKYDALGRVSEKGYTSSANWGAGALEDNIDIQSYPSTPSTWRKKYAYDLAGRISSILTNSDEDNPDEVEEFFTYDKFGNVGTKGIKVIDFNASTTYNTNYAYNQMGQATQVDYPTSPNGNVSVTYLYDQANRVKQVGQGSGNAFANYSYNDKAQLLTEVLNPSGTSQTRTFGYNSKGLLTSISNGVFSETMRDHDGTNYGEQMYHGLYASMGITGPPQNNEFLLHYDKHGRMDLAWNYTDDNWSIGYEYNTTYTLNGNLNSLQRGYEGPYEYSYKPGTNTPQGVGPWSFSSTPTGLITYAGSTDKTFTYDAFTQLPRQVTGDGAIYFQYDSRKERVYEEANSVKTVYVHGTADFPIMQKTNTSERMYVYGPGGIVATRVDG